MRKPGIMGIVLPKAEHPEQIAQVAASLIDEARVLPILETALGVWNTLALAQIPGVERVAFGAIDFQLDTGITGEHEELLYARSCLILASRVAGILPPVDGVTTALDDIARLQGDVERARRLGFGGKLLCWLCGTSILESTVCASTFFFSSHFALVKYMELCGKWRTALSIFSERV